MHFIKSLFLAATVAASPAMLRRAQQTHSEGRFEVTVVKSQAVAPGTFTVESHSAIVRLAQFRGRLNNLRAEMAGPDGATAVLVLSLDSRDSITQADLAVSVRGKEVARTIAWTAADLKRFFGAARYADGRLRLSSTGVYDGDSPSANEVCVMRWRVDIDAPVVK